MKQLRIALISIVVVLALLVCVFCIAFQQIDFIGNKDLSVIQANNEGRKKMLLEASYRNGTDYCTINLLDTTQIKINAGDKRGSSIATETYQLSEDTIIIGSIKHFKKYLNSDKMLIQESSVLYLKDSNNNFDTTKTLQIKFNKL